MPEYPAYSGGGGYAPVQSVGATDDSVQVGGTTQNPLLSAEGANRHTISTLGGSLVGNQGAQSLNAANDCVFMMVYAPVADTWMHADIQTGSTWASTGSAMDLGFYDVITGDLLWCYSNGGAAVSEATLLGATASTVYSVALDGSTGIAVTAGQHIYVAVYMASATDGCRGSNAIPKGMKSYGVNGVEAPLYGALSGQTKCPASITALGASLGVYSQAILVNIRNY